MGSGGSGVVVGVGGEEEAHESKLTIHDAAEILLVHALHFVNNFPAREGIDVQCSRVLEGDDGVVEDSGSQWMLARQGNLISAAEFPPTPAHIIPGAPPPPNVARIVARDSAGKWTWDFLPVRVPAESGLPEAVMMLADAPASASEEQGDGQRMSRGRTRTLCTPQFMLNPKNKVSELFANTLRAHPELQAWTGAL
jgi:hypothetical protein